MKPRTGILAFGVGLIVVFGAAFGIGSAVGPVGDQKTGPPALESPGGLTVTDGTYTLDIAQRELPQGPQPQDLRFRVVGDGGRPLRDYRPNHERDLHLIVVSRDLTSYQHVHPVRDAQGEWRVALSLPAPGTYRAIADFVPAGQDDAVALADDITVVGPAAMPAAPTAPLPAPTRVSTVDGYTVRLAGEVRPGAASTLRFTVERDGRPVADLEPYLGAYGHLVALRTGDLAYLHVHPEGHPDDDHTGAGPEVAFTAHVPTAGRHRLFLDFKHGGVVRTAAFTIDVVDGATAGEGDAGDRSGQGHGHGHG